jgi:hypothetical protein
MTIMTMINRMMPGDKPEFPNGSRSSLNFCEAATALAGVGVPVFVTRGKSSAIAGKGARVGVLLGVTVSVRTSVPGVKVNGIDVFWRTGPVGIDE